MGIRVGGGQAEITARLGTPFGGFAIERAACATAVHDPLVATATVIADETTALALVSCDLQTVSPGVVARARAGVAARWGIPAAQVLIAATHVHSAPGGDASERQIPGVDPYYTTADAEERIHAGILAAVAEAHDCLRAATLHGNVAEITGIGRSRHTPDRSAPASAAFFVARDRAAGEPIAAIANYGCHASILGPENTAFSADYPGVVRRELSRRIGGAAVNFLNAPAGDISTRATRRATTFAEVERLGTLLADEFARILDALAPLHTAPLAGAIASVAVPVDATLLPRLKLEAATLSGSDSLRARRLAFQIGRLGALTGRTVPCEVQVIRCGEVAFVGIAAELFSAPARAIAASIPTSHTVLVAPANGTIGNIPPPALHAEVRAIVSSEAASIIRDAVLDLCAALFSDAGGGRDAD